METIDAATTLRKSSNISSVDTRDAPRNRESAPPKVFKKSQTSGYCFFSFTSSTSRDSKKIFTYIKWKTLDKADWSSYYYKQNRQDTQISNILPSSSSHRGNFLMHPYFASTNPSYSNQVHREYICCMIVHLWSSIGMQCRTFLSIEASIHPEAIDSSIFAPTKYNSDFTSLGRIENNL